MIRIECWMLVVVLTLTGCVASNEVTPEQVATMNAADQAVSEALFDAEVDASTSYNIRKDGFVVIRFAEEVPNRVYSAVVDQLRRDRRIAGVKAEQGGRDVCVVKRFRGSE